MVVRQQDHAADPRQRAGDVKAMPGAATRQVPEIASGNASHLRGYAWHAYPDPATPGVFAGDNPFGAQEPPAPDRAPTAPPESVVDFWLVGKNTPGISQHTDGHTYLIVTEAPRPPAVVAGWSIEGARLSEDFELDQRGDRSVRLIRVLGAVETGWGPVKHCEFQVDRG